ncbi:MAG: OmpA family protein [Deltaproteobacteria bacterium]|nr:OmpA family protein [Deltaproteobacteria bacterium]
MPHRRVIRTLPLLLLLARFSWADIGASVENFKPSIGPGSYFSVLSSRGLGQWQFHGGVGINYAHQPLLRGVTNVPMVDNLWMTDIGVAAGLTDWLEFGVALPVVLFNDATSLTRLTADSNNVTRTTSRGLGDLRIQMKFRLVDLKDYDVGFAIVPILSIPTGNEDQFAADGTFSGGGLLVLDGEFLDRAEMSFNLGLMARSGFIFPGTVTERDDYIPIGVGLKIKTVDWIDLIGELNSSFLLKRPYDRESESPLEGGGGIRFRIPPLPGLALSAGVTAGVINSYGSPFYRIIGGVAYTQGQTRKKKVAQKKEPKVEATPPPPPPPPAESSLVEIGEKEIEIKKKIHFEHGKESIREVSQDILDAIIETLKNHPEILKVEIGGHTDNKGDETYNLKLSGKRAEAVKRFLVDHGVQAGRLTAKGYGESEPRDTNDTEEGRARNRRVEFKILERQPLTGTSPSSAPSKPAVP